MQKPQVAHPALNLTLARTQQANRIAARKAKEALLPPMDLSKFL